MQSLFSNALSRAVAKHIDLSVTRRDAGVADVLEHAAAHDLPVAAGGRCGERRRPTRCGGGFTGSSSTCGSTARWRACRGRPVAASRQAGSGDRSTNWDFGATDQHPDDLGGLERHGHPAHLDAVAVGGKLDDVGAH